MYHSTKLYCASVGIRNCTESVGPVVYGNDSFVSAVRERDGFQENGPLSDVARNCPEKTLQKQEGGQGKHGWAVLSVQIGTFRTFVARSLSAARSSFLCDAKVRLGGTRRHDVPLPGWRPDVESAKSNKMMMALLKLHFSTRDALTQKSPILVVVWQNFLCALRETFSNPVGRQSHVSKPDPFDQSSMRLELLLVGSGLLV